MLLVASSSVFKYFNIDKIDYEKYDVIPIYFDKNNSFYVGPDFDKLETFTFLLVADITFCPWIE